MFPTLNHNTIENDCVGVTRTMNNTGASGGGSLTVKDNSNRCMNFFDCLLPFTRFWGIFTAVVLAGVGVDLVFHMHRTGYYLIGESIFVLISEVTWVATLFLQLCIRSDHKIWKFWSIITWFQDWKKSIVYGPMGGVPLLWPHKLWLSYFAAGQLFLLAFFHGILSFKGRRRRRRKERLLHGDIESFESSKFEEVTEVLDDGLPEPMPGSSHSLSDSLAEQDTILEI